MAMGRISCRGRGAATGGSQLLALGLLALAVPAAGDDRPDIARQRQTDSPEHILVFDAGSSGTRIHVFNIYPPKAGSQVPEVDLLVRDKQTLKVKPGLSQLAKAGNISQVKQTVVKLLEFANGFVPAIKRSSTAALFKATAGLRSLPPDQADAVIATIRQTLATSGYQFNHEWADVIKGKEEAGLAWVAANYLGGAFTGSQKSTLGVIEMGGGSTQVSFQVQDTEVVAERDNFEFKTCSGTNYRLYAHSYLGFGMDYAQEKLLKLWPAFDDPCYPVGYTRLRNILINGTGSAQDCQQHVQDKLFVQEDGAPGQYQAELKLRGKFAATENFFYVRNELGLELPKDVRVMKKQAHAVCTQKLTPSQKEQEGMLSGAADVRKPNKCFGLSYQVTLLETFLSNAPENVEIGVMGQIGGGSIDWALGAALVHKVSQSEICMPQLNVPGMGWNETILLVAAIVLTLACVCRTRSIALIKSKLLGKHSPIPSIWGKTNEHDSDVELGSTPP